MGARRSFEMTLGINCKYWYDNRTIKSDRLGLWHFLYRSQHDVKSSNSVCDGICEEFRPSCLAARDFHCSDGSHVEVTNAVNVMR